MSKSLISKSLLFSVIFVFSVFPSTPALISQEQEIKPVPVGQPMPDIALPSFQGETVTLSKLKGKNVLIIFPRGYAGVGRWCTIDNYKYAELVDLEKTEQVRKKYDLEILFVFPYGKEVVQQWVDSNPDQLAKIKDWKYPVEPDKLAEKDKQMMIRARAGFPKDFSMKKGEVPTPFPILIDADRKLSKGLGIFATEWGGSKVDQNMASEMIVDKDGVVQFKYIGQNTWDRPAYAYLLRFINWMMTCR